MKDVLLSPVPLHELEATIAKVVEEKLNAVFSANTSARKTKSKKYLTRKEVAERLHISLPTLNKLTKDETLKGYRIGGRVLYKLSEVEASLVEISTTKYKRKAFIHPKTI